ncbi:hypothetical protein [Haliscomenobacter sp.]|uniref:hypothetical protein n=1 Tax=Haliscomenobacter sp. TaxID=2717303 RepID=UPI0035949320
MSIVLDLPQDLEQKLRATASAAGQNVDAYILRLLEKNVQGQPSQEKSKSIALLQLINRGLPTEVWSRFYSLVQKREHHTITDTELAELIELTDSIDLAHAQRMEALVELAVLQNKPLEALMDELGIGPMAVERYSIN